MADTSLKYFTQILSVIYEFGLTEEDCLSAANLSAMPTTDRVPAKILAEILNFAAIHFNDPQIGIKCGLKYPILQYTRPAEFLKHCENLEHAVAVYQKYCALFHTIGKPSTMLSEGGSDRIIWAPASGVELTTEYEQLIELIMTNFVTSLNWLAWKTPNAVQRVNIKHASSLPIERYHELFECDLAFGQDEYSIILQEGVKSAPFVTSDPAELARTSLKFDTALNELFESENLINSIEIQIRRALGNGIPNKRSIAMSLGLSERSMARTLKNEGTCFKDIKNRVFQSIAIAKIKEGKPLIEVAHSLGYNDQAAFTRAYKKWFGSPPGRHNISVQK